jgi:hypothetical protein
MLASPMPSLQRSSELHANEAGGNTRLDHQHDEPEAEADRDVDKGAKSDDQRQGPGRTSKIIQRRNAIIGLPSACTARA